MHLSLLGMCILKKEKSFKAPKFEDETDLERKKLNAEENKKPGSAALAPRDYLLGSRKNKAIKRLILLRMFVA